MLILKVFNLFITFFFPQSLFLGDGQEVGLWICFDPGDSLDQLSRTFDEVKLMLILSNILHHWLRFYFICR